MEKKVLERWGDLSFNYSRSNNLPSIAQNNSLALSLAHAHHSLSSSLTSFHSLSNVLSPALERSLTSCRSLFRQLSNSLLEAFELFVTS